jgi:hypothetical protein
MLNVEIIDSFRVARWLCSSYILCSLICWDTSIRRNFLNLLIDYSHGTVDIRKTRQRRLEVQLKC